MSLVTVKEQGNAVFAVHFAVKPFNQLYITNNTEHFSFKSEHAVCIAKLMKTDWLVVYLSGLNQRIKLVCIAMCSLVMNISHMASLQSKTKMDLSIIQRK